MKYSYTDHTGDGTTISFPFSFVGPAPAYLSPSHIKVYVNGVLRNHTLSGTNQVTITPAPASGTRVLIRRIVPKTTPFADFGRGNNFTGPLLNKSFLQQLYAYHEFLDGFVTEEESWLIHTNINMNGKVLKNLGDGVDPLDSVNLSQVQRVAAGIAGKRYTQATVPADVNGPAYSGVTWFHTGELRTYTYFCDGDSCQWIEDQPSEGLYEISGDTLVGGVAAGILATRVVDIRTYGGDPSGLTNSRLAFKLAIESLKSSGGGELVFPYGSYLLSGKDGSFTVPDLQSNIQWGTTTLDAQLRFVDLKDITISFIGSTLISDKTDGGVTLLFDSCKNITINNLKSKGATVMDGSTATVTGTAAVAIVSTEGNSENIVFNSLHTDKHYTPVDIFGDPASQYRVKDVILDGKSSFANGYYGVTCRGNGQGVVVKDAYTYKLNRPFFIYDTQGVEMNLVCDNMNGGFQALIKAYTSNVLNINVSLDVRNRANIQPCLGLQSQHNPALQPTPAYLRDINISYVDSASVAGGSSIRFDYYQNNDLVSTSNQFLFGDISIEGRSSGSLTSGVSLTSSANYCVLYADKFKPSNGFGIYASSSGFIPSNVYDWTPVDASVSSLTLPLASGKYTVGKSITCVFSVIYPENNDHNTAAIAGLPVKSNPLNQSSFGVTIGYTNCGLHLTGLVSSDGTQIGWYKNTGVTVTNQELSGKTIRGTVTYFA